MGLLLLRFCAFCFWGSVAVGRSVGLGRLVRFRSTSLSHSCLFQLKQVALLVIVAVSGIMLCRYRGDVCFTCSPLRARSFYGNLDMSYFCAVALSRVIAREVCKQL